MGPAPFCVNILLYFADKTLEEKIGLEGLGIGRFQLPFNALLLTKRGQN